MHMIRPDIQFEQVPIAKSADFPNRSIDDTPLRRVENKRRATLRPEPFPFPIGITRDNGRPGNISCSDDRATTRPMQPGSIGVKRNQIRMGLLPKDIELQVSAIHD
ncbi:MAG TPA: hypothetical protein P5081_17650 [Phycisphaerae bacterium]|nr:hypothetical protein [Phycisphaerae bacterium]HRW54697.1 hypothetical protein [Phycisphaerae bacterium]